jgi:hypothetical protein
VLGAGVSARKYHVVLVSAGRLCSNLAAEVAVDSFPWNLGSLLLLTWRRWLLLRALEVRHVGHASFGTWVLSVRRRRGLIVPFEMGGQVDGAP